MLENVGVANRIVGFVRGSCADFTAATDALFAAFALLLAEIDDDKRADAAREFSELVGDFADALEKSDSKIRTKGEQT